MRTISVVIRECDLAYMNVIAAYLEHYGLKTGKRAASQSVRFALETTARVINGEYQTEAERAAVRGGSDPARASTGAAAPPAPYAGAGA